LINGFFSFAICFVMIIGVWYGHYKFFRRYGLEDAFTIFLNMVMLFVVLIYIYPLKFLFNLLTNPTFSETGANSAIKDQQWPELMVIYGVGFVAIYTVFLLLHVHAYRNRLKLELNDDELQVTLSSILSALLIVCVGLASILMATFGGAQYVSWSGWIYICVVPIHFISSRVIRRIGKARQNEEVAKTG